MCTAFIYFIFCHFYSDSKCSGTAQGLYSDKTHSSLKITMIVKHLAPLPHLPFPFCKIFTLLLHSGFTKKEKLKFMLQFFKPLITPPKAKEKRKENYSHWGTKTINKQAEDKRKPAGIQKAIVLRKHRSVCSHRLKSCYHKKERRIKKKK